MGAIPSDRPSSQARAELRKQLRHSPDWKALTSCPIAVHSASMERAAIFRSRAFSLANICSEREHLLERVQERLDSTPRAMQVRRETIEHTFGTLKACMGAKHFKMKTLKHVGTEMALTASRVNYASGA